MNDLIKAMQHWQEHRHGADADVGSPARERNDEACERLDKALEAALSAQPRPEIPEGDWKCNACRSTFSATDSDWSNGFGRMAPACPRCTAVSQYTYPAGIAWKLDKLERMGFKCEGGPLANCKEWQELRQRIVATPQPASAPVEKFTVKHYTEDEGPTIKGNGFDGLRIGEDREDAEEFVRWVNHALAQQPAAVDRCPRCGSVRRDYPCCPAPDQQPAAVDDRILHQLKWIADISSDPSLQLTMNEQARVSHFAKCVHSALALAQPPGEG